VFIEDEYPGFPIWLNVVVMELHLDPSRSGGEFPRITLAPGQSKTLGRRAPADVIVDHPSISRRHARISMDTSGQLAVDDLGSTNGVFVNGTEQRSAYLMVGDVVRFGQVEYVLAEAT
jgi:hypothetical protein